MRIKLYSANQSNFLETHNYVMIYRRLFLRLEERYYKPKICDVIYSKEYKDIYIGRYLISFYRYANLKELIDSDFIKYLHMSGYDYYMDWINECIKVNSKRQYPNSGAFYLIEKYRGAVNE